MSKMFNGAASTNPDVSKWDTSKVTDMSEMFLATKSTNPDVSKWDVSNITNMYSMFNRAGSANPDVSKWNVSKVTEMGEMFSGATSANPDVSEWNVSNVTNMNSMFVGASKVKANITGLPMGKFMAFMLEALEADNTKLVEYGNSFAFMLGAVDKLSAKVNKKKRVLNIKFKAMKSASGYEAKIVINGKVKTIKLKKGKKFMVGKIRLPKRKGKYVLIFRAFKKISGIKYYGVKFTKIIR